MAKNPGTKFEEWVLQELQRFYPDAKRRKASGAVHGQGDVVAGPFEVECKDNPDQKSISITEKDWKHTEKAADKEGRMPLFFNKNKHGVFVTLKFNSFDTLLRDAIQAHIFLEGEPDAF